MATAPRKQKAEKPDIAKMGGNLSSLKDDLAKWRDMYIEFEKKRADVNAKLGEIRAKAEANGVPKKAFAQALAYFKMDPDQRSGLDNGYILAREAFGLPINGAQLSLFGDDEGEAEDDNDNDDENEGGEE
jgi:septal ring factor EnvC (AmiA/AmiB activator)